VSLARESTEGDDNPRVSEDEIFTMLSNRRRRYVVHALSRDDADHDLGSLAEQIAAWEHDVDVGELSYNERKRTYTSLQQTHLPKMDDVGLVEFDKNRGEVRPTESLTEVDLYLEVVSGDDLPWSKYYLGLCGVATTIVVGQWVESPLFTSVPATDWIAFVVAMFAVSAAVHHYYRDHRRLGTGDRPPELNEEE
jgi:predicted transcriptional regulator